MSGMLFDRNHINTYQLLSYELRIRCAVHG